MKKKRSWVMYALIYEDEVYDIAATKDDEDLYIFNATEFDNEGIIKRVKVVEL